MNRDDFTSDFIKMRNEMNEKRRAKEEKLGITGMGVRTIKDYANSILAKANNIEFTKALVDDELISYEHGRKIIDWQKKQINESIEYLKVYVNPETNSNNGEEYKNE